ncbi:MAG: hypothetical protein CMJ40_08810 [Phycisphaerae bacterium]|nr:hypothetical protein [Phycisphaerae bacterium]
MSYLADMRLAYALYEGLLRWNIEDFTLEPGVAENWSIEDGGRRLVFDLRTDARWSDGSPVTANDFTWSWMRLLLPDTAADYSNLFFSIKGADEFWDWRTTQLENFTADPWSAANPNARSDQTVSMLNRMAALGSDADLPEGIGFDPDSDLLSIERDGLLAAVDQGDEQALVVALENSSHHRRIWDALNERESRKAESEWMWLQTEDQFRRLVGLKSVNDHQLIVELDTPVPYFPDLLAFAPASPVHRPTVEGWTLDESDRAMIVNSGWGSITPPPFESRRNISISPETGRLVQSHRWARPGTLVGNGPYTLDEWRYKRDMHLSRSETHHDGAGTGFDSIEIRSIPDPNTAVLAFMKGDVDWLTGVGADCRVEMLEQRRRYDEMHGKSHQHEKSMPDPVDGQRNDIHAIPVFGTDFFSFNCRALLPDGRANPFADPAVRRAFALATDKQTIVDNVTRLGEPIASTLVPRDSIPGYQSPSGLGFDPDRAKLELASAGWIDRDGDGVPENPKGTPFPDVEVLYTTGSPRFSRMAVELRDQWQRHLGIPVVLLGQDTKFFKEDLRKGNFMIARGRWYGDYGDPTTFLELCRSTDGNNDRGFSDPAVDAALDAAMLETDPEMRMRNLAELERRLFNEDLPLIPICQLVDVTMYDPTEMTGVTHHPRLTHYLWKLRPVAEVDR